MRVSRRRNRCVVRRGSTVRRSPEVDVDVGQQRAQPLLPVLHVEHVSL